MLFEKLELLLNEGYNEQEKDFVDDTKDADFTGLVDEYGP